MKLNSREEQLTFLSDCLAIFNKLIVNEDAVEKIQLFKQDQLDGSDLPEAIKIATSDKYIISRQLKFMAELYNAVALNQMEAPIELDDVILASLKSGTHGQVAEFHEDIQLFLQKYKYVQQPVVGLEMEEVRVDQEPDHEDVVNHDYGVGSYKPALNLKKKLAYRVEAEKMVDVKYPDNFFIKGKSQLDNFKKDYYLRQFQLNDQKKLGYKVSGHVLRDESQHDNVLDAVKGLLGRSDDKAAVAFVLGHSQGPITAFFDTIQSGIPGLYEPGKKYILSGELDQMFAWKDEDGQVYLKVFYEGFPIYTFNDNGKEFAGLLPGPIEATYRLKEEGGDYGYQLMHIDSNNSDIVKILKGKTLSQAKMDKYCEASAVNKQRDPALDASIQAMREALDEAGYQSPLAEAARDVLVEVEKLSKDRFMKVSNESLIETLNKTRELISPSNNNDFADTAKDFNTYAKQLKKSGRNKILVGLIGILASVALLAAGIVGCVLTGGVGAVVAVPAAIVPHVTAGCAATGIVGSALGLGGISMFAKGVKTNRLANTVAVLDEKVTSVLNNLPSAN